MWRATSFAIGLTFFSSVAFAQQPCTTDARRVVDELYRHMLERGADAGSQQWQNQLSSGQVTVRDLVREIAKSQEHNQRYIRQETGEEVPYIRSVNTLYRHILGRQPDVDGARANARSVSSQGINAVIDSIINSAEYNQQFGDWGVPGSGGLAYCGRGNQASAPAPAQDDNNNSNNGNFRNRNNRFREMDANNDGTISRAEWQGSQVSFRQHDWNRDNVLSGDELRVDRARQGQNTQYEDFDRGDTFENLDANNNGRVELREWHASDSAFHQLDRNGDNYLSRAELAGQPGAVATNGNGNGYGYGNRNGNGNQNGNGNGADLVYVDGNQRWTDTGIDVQAGQTIVVDAQGSVQLSNNANDTATPAGARAGRRTTNLPVEQGPAGGLIARVGNAGPTFLGARGTMRAATSGRLFLGVNDDYLDDNSGEYRVNVTVRGR